MVFQIQPLAAHLQIEVLQKLEAKDSIHLQKSSRHPYILCQEVKKKVTLEDNDMYFFDFNHTIGVASGNCLPNDRNENKTFFNKPMRMLKIVEKNTTRLLDFNIRISGDVKIFQTFTEDFCQSLANLLESSNSEAKTITFEKTITCSPESFNKFLEVSKTTEIEYVLTEDEAFPVKYCETEAVKSLTKLTIVPHDLFRDKHFLALKCSRISFVANCGLTSSGLNLLLKEWMEEKRHIESIHLWGSYKTSPLFRDLWAFVEHQSSEGGYRVFHLKRGDRVLQISVSGVMTNMFLMPIPIVFK